MRWGLVVRIRLGLFPSPLSTRFLLARRLRCLPSPEGASEPVVLDVSVPEIHESGAATRALTVLKKLDLERASWGAGEGGGRSYGLRWCCFAALLPRVGNELIGAGEGRKGIGVGGVCQQTENSRRGGMAVSFCSSLPSQHGHVTSQVTGKVTHLHANRNVVSN
jgi:hypothetical protein